MMRECVVRDLGLLPYGQALALQLEIADMRKRAEGLDHLLLVEHPHVVTIGRNGSHKNVLAPEALLRAKGIELYECDRGGDVTYHGPGQLVGYPVVDLRNWKRDVGAYVRAMEQVLIDTLSEFGIAAHRVPNLTGVWVGEAKIGAIGVHLSRWISTHGWALNVNTDLNYFSYIVPCGLAKPVTSMRSLGADAAMEDVKRAAVGNFGRIFDFQAMVGYDTEDRSRQQPFSAVSAGSETVFTGEVAV
jgi:lipoate-protein ligase B